MCLVGTKQEPTAETLLDIVPGITDGGLHALDELGLHVVEGEMVKVAAPCKLAPSRGYGRRKSAVLD